MAQMIDLQKFLENHDVKDAVDPEDCYAMVEDFAVTLYNRLKSQLKIGNMEQFNKDFLLGVESLFASLDRQMGETHPLHTFLDDFGIEIIDTL